MKALIPILTGKEDEEEFIEKVIEKEDLEEVILLNVVKRDEVGEVPAGYAGTKIKEAEETMKKIKNRLPVNIKTEENLEWGDPAEKIRAISKIKNIEKVFIDQSEESEEIENYLNNLNISIEVISRNKGS